MFDSNISGLGTHRFSFIWDKKVGDAPPEGVAQNQQASSLLVVRVTVGDDAFPASASASASTPAATYRLRAKYPV